jgi:hypothetical protein
VEHRLKWRTRIQKQTKTVEHKLQRKKKRTKRRSREQNEETARQVVRMDLECYCCEADGELLVSLPSSSPGAPLDCFEICRPRSVDEELLLFHVSGVWFVYPVSCYRKLVLATNLKKIV